MKGLESLPPSQEAEPLGTADSLPFGSTKMALFLWFTLITEGKNEKTVIDASGIVALWCEDERSCLMAFVAPKGMR